MSIVASLAQRRSYYQINKNLPVSETEIVARIRELTELVPDAFDMKSSRLIIALGEKQDALWDAVHAAFGGKVSREKIGIFRAGAGTILYFYDRDVVQEMQQRFATYAGNFPGWALQASGMLQLSVWSGLRELGVGASVQHYNPVIDETVRTMFDLPESYVLVAQMPFGGIVSEPAPKEKENIDRRVRVYR